MYGQAGLEAGSVSNMEGVGAHEWTVVRIDGKYYYVDATWAATEGGPYNSMYFGLTTEDRELWAGEFPPEETKFCYEPASDFFTADDYRFDGLQGVTFTAVTDYAVDHAAQTVRLDLSDGYSFEFDMSTVQPEG